jgi:RNA polymerase-binding protein DksA
VAKKKATPKKKTVKKAPAKKKAAPKKKTVKKAPAKKKAATKKKAIKKAPAKKKAATKKKTVKKTPAKKKATTKKKAIKKAPAKKKAATKKKTVKKAPAKKKAAPKKKTVKKAPVKKKATPKKKTVKPVAVKAKTPVKKKTVKKRVPVPPPLFTGVSKPLIPILLNDGTVLIPGEKPKAAKPRKLRQPQVEEIRELLLIRREELLKIIEDELGQSQTGSKQRSADPTDQASDSADGALALALVQSDTDELNQIQAALSRVAADQLGVCEQCDCAIPIERLRALPFATTCIKCKRRLELRNSTDNMDEAWEAVHSSEEEKSAD